jgi:hypothetical protein
MKILVADLDGTLLGGDTTDRYQLHAVLARHPEVMVVFATGRGLSSVREVLADPLLPRPRWIIADAGASIVDGLDLAPVQPLQAQLRPAGPERNGYAQRYVASRRWPIRTAWPRTVVAHSTCARIS